MAEYQTIAVESSAPTAVVTINRPQVLNALNDQVMADLGSAFSALEADNSIRVVIVTGVGEKAFVAGADIGELKVCDVAGGIAKSLRGQAVLNQMEQSRLIVIAAINGFALGGGL